MIREPFDFEKWQASPDMDLQVKCALTIMRQSASIGDSFTLIQTMIASGVHPVAAAHLFHVETGKFAERICTLCRNIFAPLTIGDIDTLVCASCRKLGRASPKTARGRMSARAMANVAVKRGRLKRSPCSMCGSEPAEKHHPDYSRPLDVVWLCRSCHMAEHRRARDVAK